MKIQLPVKLEALFTPKRYKVFFGGRGGAKTVGFSKALMFKAAAEKIRVLCCREFMKSIQESVHESLSDEVQKLGMDHLFDVKQSYIKGTNGSHFLY